MNPDAGRRRGRTISEESGHRRGRSASGASDRRRGRAAPPDADGQCGRATPPDADRQRGRTASADADRQRGQVVLLAAAVIALALAAVLLAYLQLGYHGDVTASEGYDHPTRDAERALERAVANASEGLPRSYPWARRGAAATDARSDLDPRLDALEASRVESGTAYRVAYNGSAAGRYAGANCPSGPDRQFGDCAVDGGLVLQDRAGGTHLLAVALDLRVVGERRTVAETVVIHPVRGVVSR